MPTVPVSQGPRLQSAALQGGFQQGASSADAFGAAAGRQLSEFGGALDQAATAVDRIQERKDTDDAMRAEVAVKDEWRQYNSELRKRRGKNAEGLVEDASKWWDQARERFAKDLNPRAQRLIGRTLERARVSELDQVGAFQDRELDNAFIESTNADTAVELDRYATNADPKAADGVREVITRNVDLMANRLGWSTERAEQERKRFTNIAHRQMIDRLLDTSPAAAKEYLEQYRGEIAGSALPVIDREIKKAVTEDEGARIADSLAALPYEQQLAEVGKIDDPDVAKVARAKVRQNQQDIITVRAERERAASDAVWQLVANGASERELPRAMLSQMDGKDRMQVSEHFRALREKRAKEAKGDTVKTDWSLYTQLREMPAEDFRKLKLSTYVDRIGGAQMEQLLDLQDRLNKPDKEARAATSTQMLNAFVAENGLKDERKGQFQSAYYEAVTQFTKDNKREPSPEEERKIMGGLMKEVVLSKGWLWDSKGEAYRLPAGERGTAGAAAAVEPGAAPAAAPAPPAPPAPRPRTIVSVPMADRNEIIRVLRERGRPVTEDNIQLMYQAARGRPQ